jgi:hypothetical protein
VHHSGCTSSDLHVQILLPRLLTRASTSDDCLRRFFTVGTGGLVAPYFEINDFKLLGSLDGIIDSLNVNKEAGCMHLIVSEAMLLLVMLCWFRCRPPRCTRLDIIDGAPAAASAVK